MSKIKKEINKDEHKKFSHKQKELEIARQNMFAFSARKNIKLQNSEEEANYFQNKINDNMRKAVKNQNKEFKQHKLKEIEVREFNKNLILNKHNKRNDNFQLKDKDSQIYGFRNTNGQQNAMQLDPILEAGEK